MILCINFNVLSVFTGELPQGFFLGGCPEITKVGRFIICTFLGSGLFPGISFQHM